MNQDRTVCLRVDAGFRLNYIGFYKPIESNEDMDMFYFAAEPVNDIIGCEQRKNPDGTAPYEFREPNRHYDYQKSFGLCWDHLALNPDQFPNSYQKRACELVLIFNKEVDQNSIVEGLSFEDFSTRRDKYKEKKVKYELKLQTNPDQIYGIHYNTDIQYNYVYCLLISISDVPAQKNIWAPHMQHIKFYIDETKIKTNETSPEFLSNGTINNEVVKPTVLPGIVISAVSFYNGTSDTYFGDIEAYVFNSVAVQKAGGSINSVGFKMNDDGTIECGVDYTCFPEDRRPNYNTKDMSKDSWWYISPYKEIFSSSQLNYLNNIHLFFQMMDENAYEFTEDEAIQTALLVGETVISIATNGIDENTFKKFEDKIKEYTSGSTWENHRPVGNAGYLLKANQSLYVNCTDGDGGKARNNIIREETSTWGLNDIYEPRILESKYFHISSLNWGKCSCWTSDFIVNIKIELGDFW